MSLAARMVFTLAAAGALGSTGVEPAWAQEILLELRAGVAGSTAIVEDLIASPQLVQRLGGAFEGDVKAVPSPGPVLAVAVMTAMRERMAFELSAGWTFTTLRAATDGSSRKVHDLGVGHAILGVRYAVNEWWRLTGGFGAVRYFADEGLFAEGNALQPIVELGNAVTTPWLGRRLTLRAAGQIHRFGTPVIRSAGGEDGTVMRALIQAAVLIGRPTS